MAMKKISTSIDFKSQSDRSVLLEVAVRKEPILYGLWTFNIRLGKKTLMPVSNWMNVCEHKENRCDYIEMELHLESDCRLQRSMLVNHKDNILLLADTVLGDDIMLSYHTDLYVSPKLRAKTSDEANEILFRNCMRVFPLALPEWKGENGSLQVADGRLTLRQETSGKALYAPLLFDLDAERLSKRYTWRQLTVGENLQRVPKDRAVGYRIQLSKEQFLLYRSLTSQASRTVLGHNLIDDFCFARFDPDIGVEPLIAVE